MRMNKISDHIRIIVIALLCLVFIAAFCVPARAEESGEGTIVTDTDETGTEMTEPVEGDDNPDPSSGDNIHAGIINTVEKTKPTKASKKTTRSEAKLPSKIIAELNRRVSPKRGLKKYKYLYVGASRVSHIGNHIKDKKAYIYGNPGANIYWFGRWHGGKPPVMRMIRGYLAARPNGIVIIEMGNNDLVHCSMYIALYKELIKRYPEADFRFVDALPGSGRWPKGSRRNYKRAAFNKSLHKEFPGKCLGGYSYLLKYKGFRTTDGIHYPVNIQKATYQYIMKKLGRNIRYKLKGKKFYVK